MLGLIQTKLSLDGIKAGAVMIEDDGHFLKMKIDPLDVGLDLAHLAAKRLDLGADANLALREHGDLCANFSGLLRCGLPHFLQ